MSCGLPLWPGFKKLLVPPAIFSHKILTVSPQFLRSPCSSLRDLSHELGFVVGHTGRLAHPEPQHTIISSSSQTTGGQKLLGHSSTP